VRVRVRAWFAVFLAGVFVLGSVGLPLLALGGSQVVN